MAIADILRALEQQAEEECREILEAAEEEAAAIRREADEEADKARARRLKQADASGTAQAARAVNTVRLETKRNIASVKERAVGTVFADALEEMGRLRGTPNYAEVFAALAREAAEGVSGKAEVLVAAADRDLAEKTVSGLGIDASVNPDFDTRGGLVIVTGDGRVFRRNTFEDRLGRFRQSGQARVAEIMFG